MQIWAESGKSALPICNYSQILYQFLTFTQNLKRSLRSIVNGYSEPYLVFCSISAFCVGSIGTFSIQIVDFTLYIRYIITAFQHAVQIVRNRIVC